MDQTISWIQYCLMHAWVKLILLVFLFFMQKILFDGFILFYGLFRIKEMQEQLRVGSERIEDLQSTQGTQSTVQI